MPRPVTGRRTDSLFDSRFRYDHIYPRGRSGETLRAYDTHDNDRPVVIKRPAPQDAPPMRAGQEVSILNEKRALERLAGHPVLTELRHSGTFRVGGQTHQYIVVDLAEGVTVEDYVLDLASRGERLPELETLVVLDKLLDLLQAAHDKKIVYNDVDAKHLFWDRAHYRLKVIDWGNAVFLDNDSTHVTRATDVYQAAELLYFILSGGHRLEVDRRGNEPVLDLPDDISPRLKSILVKATNQDANQRYQDITTLRRDLADARRPLEKTRDSVVDRARTRLPGASSQDQLEQLAETLRDSLKVDPGYPPANELLAEIEMRLKGLSIQGDLDAARIYIESGNTARAKSLLEEVLARMGDTDQPLLHFLLDVAGQLEMAHLSRPPAGLSPALDALYRGDPTSAGRALVTTSEPRADAYQQQLLLAERLTSWMPGVVLLRPHLARLEQLLADHTSDRSVLLRISAPLDNATEPGVQPLRKVYEQLSDSLSGFAERLEGEALEACNRAQRAANDVAELLEIVGSNLLNDASRAGNALWHASAIDPANIAFDALNNTLNTFHAELEAIANAPLQADDVPGWLSDVRGRLNVYAADIPDPRFQDLIRRLDDAVIQWEAAISAFAFGGRRPAIDAYNHAAEDVQPLNESVARWFREHIRQIEEARYVETLSPNTTLGHALAEGWDAWDRGRNADAQANAARASEAAQNDSERLAAERLNRLAELTADWLNGDGLTNRVTTDHAEEQLNTLLTPAEDAIRQKFSEQMPNTTIYLKAVARGLVEPLRDISSAAVRVLMMHYILRGVLAQQAEKTDEAAFWRDAASKTLPNVRMHPAFQNFDNSITRRQLVAAAAQAMNAVRRLDDLPAARTAIRAPLAAAQLEPAEQAFRSLDDALRRWGDGDFRAAHQSLDSAIEKVNQAENSIGKPLEAFKAWLTGLSEAASELQNARRTIEQAALIPSDQPDPAVGDAHQRIVDVTWRQLGEEYASLIRQWRDTYNSIRELYQNNQFTKAEKLRLLEGNFASLFIDRHPAYPIYRHWQSVISLQPDVKPVYTEAAAPGFVEDTTSARSSSYTRDAAPPTLNPPVSEPIPTPEPEAPPETRFPWLTGVAVVAVVLVVLGIGAIVLGNRQPPPIALTLPVSPTTNAAALAFTMAATSTHTSTATTVPTLTDTPLPSSTPTITPVPPSETPTPLRLVPTETRGATAVPSVPAVPPMQVSTIAPTERPTLAAGIVPGSAVPNGTANATSTVALNAQSGDYKLLDDLAKLPADNYTWTSDLFTVGPDGNWQFGTTNPKAGNTPQILRIGPSVLGAIYGSDASRHVTRVDATMELVSYDKKLTPTGQVYFALGFEAAQNQRAMAQVQLVEQQIVKLGPNINGRFSALSRVPTGNLRFTLSARRNPDNTVSVYADNQLLGTTASATFGPATPVSIVLVTSAQGVIVSVSSISIHIG